MLNRGRSSLKTIMRNNFPEKRCFSTFLSKALPYRANNVLPINMKIDLESDKVIVCFWRPSGRIKFWNSVILSQVSENSLNKLNTFSFNKKGLLFFLYLQTPFPLQKGNHKLYLDELKNSRENNFKKSKVYLNKIQSGKHKQNVLSFFRMKRTRGFLE